MRIGIVVTALAGGGAERQALIWCQHCAAAGHEVTAITFWTGEGEADTSTFDTVRIFEEGREGGLGKITLRLRQLQGDFDCMVVFEPFLGVCATAARLKIPWALVTGKVPAILQEATRIPLFAFRWAFRRTDLATAPNEAMVEGYRARGIRASRPWLAVPNVVDPAAFFDWDGPKEGVLWVGRFETVKNPFLAIDAATAAGLPLTMLGYGRLQPEVEAHIAARSARPPVELRPFGGNPWQAYARHRVLLVTSHYESFGNVLVESLAAGTPVVSVDCDYGPRELIGGAEHSRLLPGAAAPEELGAALREIAGRAPDPAEKAEGRRIADRYRIEAVAPVIDTAIDRLRSAR